jgi:septal ring factor EnvC (AmiA/AmiB activator)
MRNKITVSVFNEATYKNKQVAISKISLFSFVSAAGIGLIFFGLLLADYHQLCHTTTDPLILGESIDRQNQQLAAYNEQIDFLNQKIDTLQVKMRELQSQENKIRKIAGIKPSINDDNLFGVGGSKATSAENSMDVTTETVRPDELTTVSSRLTGNASLTTAAILKSPGASINPITSLPSSLPVNGAIIKKFEIYKSHLTGNQELYKGIAITTDPMVGIKTPASGIIAYHTKNANGHIVMIDHGHGFTTRYTYLANLSKNIGDSINEGDVIGFLPESDAAQGDHNPQLHYEVFFNGIQVNPETFISQCPFLM